MAYISGTATNDTNLVETLITFLTANSDLVAAKQNWELLGRQSVVTGNITQDYMSLRGPGLAEADKIYIHLEHYQYATTDTFSLRIVGSAGFLASSLTTPGSQPDNTMTNTAWTGNVILRMPLHRNPMQYWIVASGRRFIMVINHGNRWGVMHGGFILPFGFPDQYPYPLLVGACNSTSDSYQTPPVSNFIYTSVSAQAGALRKPGGGWCGGPLGVGAGTGRYTCWPFDRGASWQITSGTPMLNNMIPLTDNDNNTIYAMLPLNLISRIDTDKAMYGSLDGLYFVNSFNAQAGDTLTKDGDTYLIFQMETSTTNAHHFALKLA